MADAPKRKKLEKTPEPVYQSVQKFYCCRCGSAYSKQRNFFPVSHSPMYRGSGFCPICNECVDALYEDYRERLGDDKEAMRRMCMKLDLYWNEEIYNMVEKSAGVRSRVRTYLSKTNMIKYIDKTFDDTLDEEALQDQHTSYNPPPVAQNLSAEDDVERTIDQSVIDFWGAGYTPDFYDELERRYREWTEDLADIPPNERSLYRQICLLETLISRDGAQGKPIDKNVNSLNTLLGSMNLKPAQKKSEADAVIDSTPFGVWIKRWEDYRPIPDDEGEDDTLVQYILTWFYGHVSKMFGIKNAHSKLYDEAIEKYRVDRPEFADEEDDDTFLYDIFTPGASEEDNTNE